MLPRNQRMELLSKAYVRAVAAQAGCSCEEVRPDLGIDLTIRRFIEVQGAFFDAGALLDVQLKSTTLAGVRETADGFHYDLAVRNYNHLRIGSPDGVAKVLLVFLLPEDETEWLTQDRDGLTIRGCCYYLSLDGLAETTNERRVTLSIPFANVFSPSYLQNLQKG